MSTSPNLSRWELAVNNLVADTQDEKVPWKPVKPNNYVPGEETVGAVFRVEWNNKNLLLFRRRYAYTNLNIFNPILPQFASPKEKTAVRAELAIYDTNTKTIIYRFPQSEVLEDLYRAATYHVAGVDAFVDALLLDDPD